MWNGKNPPGMLMALLLLISIFLSGCPLVVYEAYEAYENGDNEEQPREKPPQPATNSSKPAGSADAP